MAYDAGRKLLWVNLQDQKRVQAFDAELKPVTGFNLAGAMPTGLLYDQRLDRLYVSVRSAVLAIDAKTGAEVGRVSAPSGVDQLWLDAASKTIFAVANGTVMLIHADDQLKATTELPVDVKGQRIAFDPSRQLVFVPGGFEGRSKILILRQLSSAPAQQTVATQQGSK
jgi:hypothetical protein